MRNRVGKFGSFGLAALLACAGVSLAGSASALPLVGVSGGVRFLYGSPSEDVEPDPYRFGLGGRLGLSLPMSIYLGASVDYFFGQSVTALDIDQSSSVLQTMARVGYELGVWPLNVRPVLGLGWARNAIELDGALVPGSAESESSDNFVLAPGVDVDVSLGLISLSAEARYNMLLGDEGADGFIFGLGTGFSF